MLVHASQRWRCLPFRMRRTPIAVVGQPRVVVILSVCSATDVWSLPDLSSFSSPDNAARFDNNTQRVRNVKDARILTSEKPPRPMKPGTKQHIKNMFHAAARTPTNQNGSFVNVFHLFRSRCRSPAPSAAREGRRDRANLSRRSRKTQQQRGLL